MNSVGRCGQTAAGRNDRTNPPALGDALDFFQSQDLDAFLFLTPFQPPSTLLQTRTLSNTTAPTQSCLASTTTPSFPWCPWRKEQWKASSSSKRSKQAQVRRARSPSTPLEEQRYPSARRSRKPARTALTSLPPAQTRVSTTNFVQSSQTSSQTHQPFPKRPQVYIARPLEMSFRPATSPSTLQCNSPLSPSHSHS